MLNNIECVTETEKVLIHIHVPKCAGTSINAFLASKFPGQSLAFSDPKSRDQFLKLGVKQRDDMYAFLFGHIVYGVHTNFSKDYQYFSALRDPIERICSYFNFVHSREDHPDHEFFKKNIQSIEDISTELVLSNDCLRLNLSNYACRAYSGVLCKNHKDWLSVSDVIETRVNSGKLFLGKIDAVMNFLVEINACEKDDVLPRENVAKIKKIDSDIDYATVNKLSQACYQTLCALNTFDIRLYEKYARS